MAVRLDLRRDLPKVRKQWDRVSKAQKTRICDYTAPCVVGAMVSPRKRAELENAWAVGMDGTGIDTLIQFGFVVAPGEQRRDIKALQEAFDSGDRARFTRKLRAVEKKYLERAA